MTALTKKLSKSWIAAAAVGALFAGISAMPTEAGAHDHFHRGQGGGHGGGQHGGFHGQQMQHRPVPHIPQIQQRQPQFNRGVDRRINHMQEQVREMQRQARQMQQIQRQREQMIYQQRLQQQQERLRLQQQWRRQQRWGQDRYYNAPAYAPPVYQQGPTREDYDECLAVQRENDGCYVDMRGGIHYIERQRDNGGVDAAQILMQALKAVKDAGEREQLQKQLFKLEQEKKAVEAQRDELLKKQGTQAVPEPTVESGELDDDATNAIGLPKTAAPKPQ
jgi:hypothetical protein